MNNGTYCSDVYMAFKAAGICPGCREPHDRDTTYCAPCVKYNTDHRNLSPAQKRRDLKLRRKWNKKRREQLIKAGRCVDGCGSRELVAGTQRCEGCRQHRSALHAARAAKKKKGRVHLCSVCRQPNHDARTCQQRYVVPPIEHFASARPGDGATI